MDYSFFDFLRLIGSLALFLYGMKIMSEGLQKFAGDSLRRILTAMTTNRVTGVLTGVLITALIQSSSATTVMVVSFVNAGLLTLTQSIGVIMGANIGTVITSVFVGLKVSQYAVYFIILGAAFLMFSKNKKTKYMGQIIFGFGCLFYGLELMGDNLANISKVPEFTQVANYLSQNPWLGLLGGTLLTTAVQSSAAVIAIAQQMYGAGAIGLSIALPFLFGSNIGTTITAVLASFGGTVPAKRAAFFHVLFNVVGSLLFMIVLSPFTLLIEWLAGALNILPELQLSVAHGIFNVVTTAFFFPLIPAIVKLIKKILPSSKKEINMDLSELDQNVVQLFPSHALAIAKNKIIEMGHITIEAVEGIRAYFETKNPLAKDGVYEMENAINTLDSKITEYLVLISHETLNDHDSNDYLANMKTIKDFERIGDLCINIVKYYEAIYDEKEDFSPEAREDLEAMMDMVIDMLNHAVKAFDTHDLDDIVYVDDKEADLDYFNKKAKQRHIKRVGRKIENSALVNSTYVDILANLERMGDHCQNISESYLLDESAYLNEEPESAFSK